MLDVFKSLPQAVNYFFNAPSSKTGQVDSPESLERPEITEMTEILINVTKCLTKLKIPLNKFCLREILHQKTVRITFSMDSGFLNTLYGKKRKPGNAESQQKAFSIKKHPVLMISEILFFTIEHFRKPGIHGKFYFF